MFGPTLAKGGSVTVRLRQPGGEGPVYVDIEAAGITPDTEYRIDVPGYALQTVIGAVEGIRVERELAGSVSK